MTEKVHTLVIVESPSKSKTITKILGDGYHVIATRGHIADLSSLGKFNLGVFVDRNFETKYVLDPEKRVILQSIITTAQFCKKILIATDPDREGEVIAHHVAERIKTVRVPIKRVEFHEITKRGVMDALSKERDIDMNLVSAAVTRRVLDRMVGFIISPIAIDLLGQGMSAGRVQSVALRLVTDREDEINSFIPEEYWTIKTSLVKFGQDPFTATVYSKNKIESKNDADAIVAKLSSAAFKVTKVTAKPRNRNPPPPLTTATLQSMASSRLKIAIGKTMEVAQELYQGGLITYMRTDSTRLSDDSLKMVRGWLETNHSSCLPKTPNHYANKGSAQDGHEAIRPTDVNVLPAEHPKNAMEKIYKLIWNMFVASQMTPAVYNTTSVVIKTNNGIELRANGRVLKDPGWTIITTNAAAEDEEDTDDKRLPDLIVDDILALNDVKQIDAQQKFTIPPPRYKEHSLVTELEKRGIGRPSTYKEIITKITSARNFVNNIDDSFVPSEKGFKLVKFLRKHFKFMEYDYTANLEAKLDLIKAKKLTYEDAVADFYKTLLWERRSVRFSFSKTDYTCAVCGFPMKMRGSVIGMFLGCTNYPLCKNTINCDINGKVVSPSENQPEIDPAAPPCPVCTGPMVVRTGLFGEFYSCKDFPICKGKAKIPYGKKCPECNNELYRTIWKDNNFHGPVLFCMGYPSCIYHEKLDDPEWFEKISGIKTLKREDYPHKKFYEVK